MKNIFMEGKTRFFDKLKEFNPIFFIRNNKFYSISVVAAFLVGIYFSWTLPETFVFAIFISSVLKPVDSRFFAVPGLFFLALTPVILYFGEKKMAEDVAVFAFYFLVMTVMMAFVELKREEKGA